MKCGGLFAGTNKSGKRAVYCDLECSRRISLELTTLVGSGLEAQALPPEPVGEAVEDVQALSLQSEEEVKALFKDFKRLARAQKQGRQLDAAQLLLLNARRWTAPFRWVPPGGASATAMGARASQDTFDAAGATAATAYAVGETTVAGRQGHGADGASPGPSVRNTCVSSGQPGASEGCDGDRALPVTPANGAAAGLPGVLSAALRSHPVPELPSSEADDSDGTNTDNNNDDYHEEGLQDRRQSTNAASCANAAGDDGQASSHANGISAASTVAATAAAELLAPHLRVLRTSPGPDPSVAEAAIAALSETPQSSRPPGVFGADSSGYSSLTESTAVTPCWGPATPRAPLQPGQPSRAPGRWYGVAGPDAAGGEAGLPGWQPPPARQRSGRGGVPRAGSFREGGAEGVLVVCCCVDLEWWERDSSKVTEVGWTMWDNLTGRLESRHHIVAENEALVNRIHVPDHKHEFQFGSSTNDSLAAGAAALQDDLDHYGERVWAQWGARAVQQAVLEQAAHQQEWQQPQLGEQQEGQLQAQGQGQVQGEVRVNGDGAPHSLPQDKGRLLGNGLGTGTSPERQNGDAATTPCSAYCSAGGEAAGEEPSGDPPVPPMPRTQVILVGHGLSQDLKALSSLLGVALPPGAAILDTADLARAVLRGTPGQEWTAVRRGTTGQRQPVIVGTKGKTISLRVLLKTLDIPATKLHNGGNDARYTMEAMLALVGVEPRPLAPPPQQQ